MEAAVWEMGELPESAQADRVLVGFWSRPARPSTPTVPIAGSGGQTCRGRTHSHRCSTGVGTPLSTALRP